MAIVAQLPMKQMQQPSQLSRKFRLRTVAAWCSALFLLVYVTMLIRMYKSLSTNDTKATTTMTTTTTKNHGAILVHVPKHVPIIRGIDPGHQDDETAFARPTDSYRIDLSDVWETNHNNNLPVWMKEYFRWHKEARSSLSSVSSSNNWNNKHRYLVLMCHEKSNRCGGTADRLSAMPFLLRLAARSHRIILIHWGRPAHLEEFLLPPKGGMDWRFPSSNYFKDTLLPNAEFAASERDLVSFTMDPQFPVITCRFQSDDHGATYYDTHKLPHEPTFAQVTRDTFRVLFTPTHNVAKRVVDFMNEWKLIPYHYVGTHLRALYAVDDQKPSMVYYWTLNAINCSSQLLEEPQSSSSRQQPTIFFAADNLAASILAFRYGASVGMRVVTRQLEQRKEPLHLDKASDWKNRDPREYYDAFVDLYLLSMSQCVTYGMGGFGKFASWLSANVSCSMQHSWAVGEVQCDLKTIPSHHISGNPTNEGMDSVVDMSIFLPPMPPPNHDNDDNRMPRMTKNLSSESKNYAEESEFPIIRDAPLTDLWEASQIMPDWMKNYFCWHKEQRKLLTPTNWLRFRYLIMECIESAAHCGGTADRLRSIPFIIRLAAETNRILFIYWEKPKPLESFLLPPRGGLDWRMPSWLVKKLSTKSYGAVNKILPVVQERRQFIVQSRLQAHDHGSKYYDERALLDAPPMRTFREVYRDCWHSLFTPVPAIAKIVEDELERLELEPGKFSFVHLRALYGVETVGRDPDLIKNWTLNSLNCMSNLRPGGPYLFSSDSQYARQVAAEYGTERHVRVVSRTHAPPPLHLEVAAEDWKQRSASEYYDVFVDLYLMSMGRCMAYNVGGFAKWAQLISGKNFTCNIRHWTMGVDKKSANKSGCIWTDPAVAVHDHPSSRSTKRGPVKIQRPLFLPPMDSES